MALAQLFIYMQHILQHNPMSKSKETKQELNAKNTTLETA
jgi:hypothetical protein